MGGRETNIALKGVSAWEYSKGGYHVILKYHITNPMVAFDMNLETFGRDSKPGEPKGRQWQVVLPKGDTAIPPESRKMTPRGREAMEKTRMAEQFAAAWVEKVNEQQWTPAYLDTLAPSKRSGLSGAELLEGSKVLESGKLIRLDEKGFWTGKHQRAEIIQRVRKTFQPGTAGSPPTFIMGLGKVMPLVRESEDQTTMFVDMNLRYLEEGTGKTQYIVQGQLVVTSREADAASSMTAWRIEALDVESGRTPPAEPSRSPPRRN